MRRSRIEDKRPHTREAHCPKCAALIEYWSTSGMSECYPHFYCNHCSNVIWQKRDYAVIRPDSSDIARALPQIVANLPPCPCGGKFTLDAGPKCPKCNHEFKEQITNLELRATNPYAVLFEGAEMLTEV